MRVNRSTSQLSTEASPVLLGLLGVLSFSVTFPATTLAEESFSPVLVGVGRSVLGAVIAVAVLAAKRERLLPPREPLGSFLVVVATVGVGFAAGRNARVDRVPVAGPAPELIPAAD
jgi:drug/metabolite transporter (DMT)-like permease